MGRIVNLWEGLISAVADAIYQLTGRLLIRTTATASIGASSLTVQGTHRWASSGRLVAGGVTHTYSGKTNTTLTGLNPVISAALPAGSVVMDLSQQSEMDHLQGAFLVDYAVEDQLDKFAANFGITRPNSVNDDDFRDLLKVLIFAPVGTVYSCRQVLDILYLDAYELYEDLISDPLTVHVVLDSVLGDPTGKTYIQGGEPQPSTGPATVNVDHDPIAVWGVWASTDPYRLSTNYVNRVLPCSTNAGFPDRLFTTGSFSGGDVGKTVVLDSEQPWRVLTFYSSTQVKLGALDRYDAQLSATDPTLVTTGGDWFRPWMVGHTVRLFGTRTGNSGDFVIAGWASSRVVELTGGSFLTESNVRWVLVPTFGTDLTVSAEIPRATVAGATITCPSTLPSNVLVDYSTVESAQTLEDENELGIPNGPSPFYLYVDGAIGQDVLDLITAAGVRVVVESAT